MEVKLTGRIPICPHCKVPTKRTQGMTTSTAMYFEPIYDEQGNNTNPDRNIRTTDYSCFSCVRSFMVSGNGVDGYKYKE